MINVGGNSASFSMTDGSLAPQITKNGSDITLLKQNQMKPYFIEGFATFTKYGYGVPTGIANYTGGNYFLNISGNAGDSFVTVTGGVIADAGTTTQWACVIQNDNGIFDMNKVMSTDGVNKVNLFKPLKKSITNGLLGNLHDANLGQHYTQLGYYAFTQNIYYANPRYAERNDVTSQFLGTDTSGKWTIVGTNGFNTTSAISTSDSTFKQFGTHHLFLYSADNTKYLEWEEQLQQKKGYLESYIGTDTGTAKVDFYLDDVLVDTKTVSREVERIIFTFENATKGRIRITPQGPFNQYVRVGNTTWFINKKYAPTSLIPPSSKVVYMGDSWGVYHNNATTRELTRLMTADGGSPTVLNYSRGGHSSTYAKEGFMQYVVNNKPDIVIIEYFVNDFNSIDGTNLGTFVATDGSNQPMNIASLSVYTQNMQWMIDTAIQYGIQPIVIMPHGTNSDSQTTRFADKAVQIWNGAKVTTDTPSYQTVTALSKVISNTYEASGSGDITIRGKSINASNRKGVMIDSDQNLTGGDIGGVYNNGVRKIGFKYDGTVELPFVKLQPDTFSLPANAGNYGLIHLKTAGGIDDVLEVVIKLADGTYITKKIQLF